MERTTRIVSFATSLFLAMVTYGQPGIEWQKCLGGSDEDVAFSIQQTTDSGYIVAGWSDSNGGDASGNHGGSDLWVVKLDGSGNIQWQKCLGGSGTEGAFSTQQTTDGGHIVAGWSGSNDGNASGNHGGLSDMWVVKLDGSGNIQWQKCLGGSGEDMAWSIQQTTDGGYIVAGSTASNDGDVSDNHGGFSDMWVVKLDSDGNIQWQKCLGGSGEDGAFSIQQTTDGGYIVAGSTASNDGDMSGNHGSIDAWVVKLDGSGNIQWMKCLGGSGYDAALSIQQTTDDGYIVVGHTTSNDGDVSGCGGQGDTWVVKLNATGTIQWQKCLGGTGEDGAGSVQQTIDGGYIVAGSTASDDGDVSGDHGFTDIWVVKLDGSGNIQWQKCLGGSEDDTEASIQQTTDGGYIVAGRTGSNNGDVSGNHGWIDAWVVKLGPNGVGIPETTPAQFSIAPNPTNGVFAITFAQHAQASHLTLLDATGRMVLAQPIANTTGPVTIDISGHESGVYFVQVRFADGTRAVERLVKR